MLTNVVMYLVLVVALAVIFAMIAQVLPDFVRRLFK
jgi:hypothetical protein